MIESGFFGAVVQLEIKIAVKINTVESCKIFLRMGVSKNNKAPAIPLKSWGFKVIESSVFLT